MPLEGFHLPPFRVQRWLALVGCLSLDFFFMNLHSSFLFENSLRSSPFALIVFAF
jgi:hypothetical protein